MTIDKTLVAVESQPVSASDDLDRKLRAVKLRQDVIEKRRVAIRLREAMAQDGLVQYYQPHVNLQSDKIIGSEATVRLQHNRRGLLLPHNFMPAAERSEIINDLGAWMLTRACTEAAGWPTEIGVSIRLTYRQLQSSRLVKHLIEALSVSNLVAARLELELTEAMLIDENDDISFNLKAIRGLGVRLALGEFGEGYMALSALRRLPLSTLKLGYSLTQSIRENNGNRTMLNAVVEAAHALGCTVLADGVDSLEQSLLLQNIGCDAAQGAYFSQPLPAAEFLALLNNDYASRSGRLTFNTGTQPSLVTTGYAGSSDGAGPGGAIVVVQGETAALNKDSFADDEAAGEEDSTSSFLHRKEL